MAYNKTIWKDGDIPKAEQFNNFEDGIESNDIRIDSLKTEVDNIQLIPGPTGPKGDPFVYSDFTQEQLELLKGPTGPKGEKGNDGVKGDTGATGSDGFSPTVTVKTNTSSEYVLDITTKTGTTTTPNLKGPKGDGSNVDLSGYVTKEDYDKHKLFVSTKGNWTPNTDYKIGDTVSVGIEGTSYFQILQAKVDCTSSNNPSLDKFYEYWVPLTMFEYIDDVNNDIYSDAGNVQDCRMVSKTTMDLEIAKAIAPLLTRIKALEDGIAKMATDLGGNK